MTALRIGVISPTPVAFPTVDDAFAELWPEAAPVRILDDSLYADFINDDFSVPAEQPAEAYERVARLLRYSRESGAEGIIFCGSVFGRLVEAGRDGFDVPVLTSYEAMIEQALAEGPRLGVLSTADGSLQCLADDVARYAETHSAAYSIDGRVVDGAFQKVLDGDRDGHDDLIVAAAAELTDCNALMLAQFSMGLVPQKIAPVAGRPVLTAPHCAVAKLRSLLA